MVFSLFMAANSQNIVRDSSGNYTTVKRLSARSKETGHTFTNSKGESFPLMESVNGKLYYIRTSKTGNEYKVYLHTEN